MRLTKARVTNYRSVLDSGEFTLEGTTCLVGKNESGKTTVLHALERLNPFDASRPTLDKNLDYPRAYLAEYSERHPDGHATAVLTTWALDDADVAALAEELGKDCVKAREVDVSREYDKQSLTWYFTVDEAAAIRHLLTKHDVKATEKKSLAASTVNEYQQELKKLGEKASAAANAVGAIVTKWPSAGTRAVQILAARMPKFLYFSSYDRMDGRVHLNTLQVASERKTLKPGQDLFLDFLSLANTGVSELLNAKTHEQLTAKVEAASISISRQIFAYWSQNKNLKVEFSVEAGREADPEPFNSGWVMHTRIRNKLHDMTVPFDDRSAGFTWFFSFLVKFSQVKKQDGNVIILLDEPGLNLHAKAQSDLLRYIKEKLEPHHQVVYTTHSPFMVPADNLLSVRTVEDVVRIRDGDMEVLGTKVGDDVLSTDRDTLFPLQGALGYELSQSLYVGPHVLLVEGPSDILYMQTISDALKSLKRVHLDRRWTVCPTGGVDKVNAFVSLFGGNKLQVAALIDYSSGQKSSVEKLRASGLFRDGHILLASEFCGQSEGDVEDILGEDLFVELVNNAYSIPAERRLIAGSLPSGGGANLRTLNRVEAAMRLIPEVDEFDHFKQAAWFLQNPAIVDPARHSGTFDRFEKLFTALNQLLPAK